MVQRFNGLTVQLYNEAARLGIHYHIGSPERLYVHIVENYVDAFQFKASKTYLWGT